MNCFLQSARYLCHQSASSRRSCSCHLLPRSPRPLPDSSSSSLLLRLNPPILFCHPPPSFLSVFLLPVPPPHPSQPSLSCSTSFSSSSSCSRLLLCLFHLPPPPLLPSPLSAHPATLTSPPKPSLGHQTASHHKATQWNAECVERSEAKNNGHHAITHLRTPIVTRCDIPVQYEETRRYRKQNQP